MMFLIQPISCIPTVISEKSLANTPSSSAHRTVGFFVRVFLGELLRKKINLQLRTGKCVHLLPVEPQRWVEITLLQKFWALYEQDTIFCLFLLKHMRFEMLSPSCRPSHSRGQLDV